MRFFSRLASIVVIACAGLVGWLTWLALSPIPLANNSVEFNIRPGVGLRGAAKEMVAAGVGIVPWQFSLLGRITGQSSAIKAGSYQISTGITHWRLLRMLAHGNVLLSDIVLVEGRTFHDFRAVLNANPNLRHDSAELSDHEILVRIGADEDSPEGLFFPDTYLFAKQSSDLEVLRRAYRAMQKHLAAEWQNRAPDLPYATPYQALIMASIVEKETGLDTDRPLVAAVFVNRLRRGMLLQTDPTVIYGLGAAFDGNLRKRDLLTDTPYNTYTRLGLPPTPIAMPSLAALRAALQPARSDALYFVGRGDGSSVFSRTLDEHNRAVAKYQKRRR
jgi:peptidoglycan lytic transglycosylase G